MFSFVLISTECFLCTIGLIDAGVSGRFVYLFAEGTLSALRGYNEHLLRIRQKSTVFNKILEQVNKRYIFYSSAIYNALW